MIIIDFGCADTADSVMLKVPAGTPLYTPPSRMCPGTRAVPADDLYGLGMKLLEIAPLCRGHGRRRLTAFGRRLCRGEFRTPTQALAAFRRKAPTAAPVAAAALLAAAIILAFALALYRASDHSPRQSVAAADIVDIDRYALAAGPLLAKVEAGTASPAERRDAAVIAMADSIYRHDLMQPLSGHEYGAEARAALADSVARRHYAAIAASVPAIYDGSDGADSMRACRLLRARIAANLMIYHSRRP